MALALLRARDLIDDSVLKDFCLTTALELWQDIHNGDSNNKKESHATSLIRRQFRVSCFSLGYNLLHSRKQWRHLVGQEENSESNSFKFRSCDFEQQVILVDRKFYLQGFCSQSFPLLVFYNG